MKSRMNKLALVALATLSCGLLSAAQHALAVDRQWGGAGAGSWTNNTKWTGDTVPTSSDGAFISVNGAEVTLSDGSTQTPIFVRIASEFTSRTAELNITNGSTISYAAGFPTMSIGTGDNNVGMLNMSGGSTFTGIGTDANWGSGSGAVANVNLNNSTINYNVSGGDGFRWGLGGATANVALTNNSRISTVRELQIGFQVANGKANISLSTDSDINVTQRLRLGGSDTSSRAMRLRRLVLPFTTFPSPIRRPMKTARSGPETASALLIYSMRVPEV